MRLVALEDEFDHTLSWQKCPVLVKDVDFLVHHAVIVHLKLLNLIHATWILVSIPILFKQLMQLKPFSLDVKYQNFLYLLIEHCIEHFLEAHVDDDKFTGSGHYLERKLLDEVLG